MENKADLVPGPWHDEPDREEFVYNGFSCLLNRNSFGAWCGYVAVPEDHPWFGKNYDDIDASVHGGLTYSHQCQGEICHVAEPGMPDDVWWLGFDCAHYGDLMPPHKAWGEMGIGLDLGGMYKDIDYVRRETKLLADQAREAYGPQVSVG